MEQQGDANIDAERVVQDYKTQHSSVKWLRCGSAAHGMLWCNRKCRGDLKSSRHYDCHVKALCMVFLKGSFQIHPNRGAKHLNFF